MSLKIRIPVNLLLLLGGYPREYENKDMLILLPFSPKQDLHTFTLCFR
ncbi:unnamed protein product [Acanthoscelides obtectus]|uniref:Uncharacterized protein n=1 Tax=Acanthoscelides obtectus TaxID=200917 RepID=A0A9P0MEC3_ACAOB|nr:unnamed protein product [Acanthoscelides obtectus]CAK1672580.1 hypothetical protein AOBTE_LOCUS28979 [Acanthoscelides obtectus]